LTKDPSSRNEIASHQRRTHSQGNDRPAVGEGGLVFARRGRGFFQKRYLETADLSEPPLDMFGADAVERWFTEKEVEEVVEFANRMSVTS